MVSGGGFESYLGRLLRVEDQRGSLSSTSYWSRKTEMSPDGFTDKRQTLIPVLNLMGSTDLRRLLSSPEPTKDSKVFWTSCHLRLCWTIGKGPLTPTSSLNASYIGYKTTKSRRVPWLKRERTEPHDCPGSFEIFGTRRLLFSHPDKHCQVFWTSWCLTVVFLPL